MDPVPASSTGRGGRTPHGGAWRLRAVVPDGIFTLAIEADDETAAAQHAAFAERCLPVLAARQSADGSADLDLCALRRSVTAELAALRCAAAGSGLGYLGAVAGRHEGRPALVLLSIAAMPVQFPDAIDTPSLLTSLLRHAYPDAAVEEFPTVAGIGVGIRRCEELALPWSRLPVPVPEDVAATDALHIDTGVSQAFVPFPEAGLLATVTGYCYNPRDIDVAAVFTATMAFRLTVTQGHADHLADAPPNPSPP
jgi:hypothetical protein